MSDDNIDSETLQTIMVLLFIIIFLTAAIMKGLMIAGVI